MSTMQGALLAGAVIGLGLAVWVFAALPPRPNLQSLLDQLSPELSAQQGPTGEPAELSNTQERLGMWVVRRGAPRWWSLVPKDDLDLLRISLYRYYGEKVTYFFLGLIFPVFSLTLLALLDVRPPITVPVIASLALGLLMSFIPDYNVRSDAAKAREEFSAALVAYIDLVALELRSGSGSRQALESAATVGDSWVFHRLAEDLGRSRWSGIPPWDGLLALSQELTVPELADVADVMRLSGEEGAAVAHSLSARAAAMRAAATAREHGKANAIGERMSLPVSALALVFLILVAAPPFFRILGL